MPERILYEANPPMFRNNPIGFVLSVLLIPVGVGIVILVVWAIASRTKKLTITETEVKYETGLLSKSRTELRLDGIRSVRVNQSFFQRLFGTGDVEVYTAGDSPEIVIAGMPDPERIRELT